MPLQVKDKRPYTDEADLASYGTGSLVRITGNNDPDSDANAQLVGCIVMVDDEDHAVVIADNEYPHIQQGMRLTGEDMDGLRGVEVNATMEVH